jgi:hypothetical protein
VLILSASLISEVADVGGLERKERSQLMLYRFLEKLGNNKNIISKMENIKLIYWYSAVATRANFQEQFSHFNLCRLKLPYN